jgi:hypothetical protein
MERLNFFFIFILLYNNGTITEHLPYKEIEVWGSQLRNAPRKLHDGPLCKVMQERWYYCNEILGGTSTGPQAPEGLSEESTEAATTEAAITQRQSQPGGCSNNWRPS